MSAHAASGVFNCPSVVCHSYRVRITRGVQTRPRALRPLPRSLAQRSDRALFSPAIWHFHSMHDAFESVPLRASGGPRPVCAWLSESSAELLFSSHVWFICVGGPMVGTRLYFIFHKIKRRVWSLCQVCSCCSCRTGICTCTEMHALQRFHTPFHNRGDSKLGEDPSPTLDAAGRLALRR